MMNETLTYVWTPTGVAPNLLLGNGVGNITYTPAVDVRSADEVCLLVTPLLVSDGSSLSMIVQWAPAASVTRWCNDTFVTTAQVLTTNTITPYTNIWAIPVPNGTGIPFVFAFPVQAHLMRVGFYQNGAVTLTTITLDIERQRSSSTQP